MKLDADGVQSTPSASNDSELLTTHGSLVVVGTGIGAEADDAMVERILDHVRAGARVCVAFYGHPGVFVAPSHDAIRRAREEGFEARMLPAVSAEDCLFADLGVDPARDGCQSYEASDFIMRRRMIDTSAALVLWQSESSASRHTDASSRRSGCSSTFFRTGTPRSTR